MQCTMYIVHCVIALLYVYWTIYNLNFIPQFSGLSSAIISIFLNFRWTRLQWVRMYLNWRRWPMSRLNLKMGAKYPRWRLPHLNPKSPRLQLNQNREFMLRKSELNCVLSSSKFWTLFWSKRCGMIWSRSNACVVVTVFNV